MPFKLNFRKSIKIAPGVKVNLSKSGIGTSVGGKHARITTGPRGTKIRGGAGMLRYEKQVSSGHSKPVKKRRWWLLWLG